MMKLLALPAFDDNYVWMLHDGQRAWVVDPGDAAPVVEALDRERLQLAGILVTHHHGDHVGGIAALRPLLQGPVYGPGRESIPKPFEPVEAGDLIDVLGLRFDVIDVPGHTAGHIAYHAAAVDGRPLLFCGDTLFSAGCGRLFEGTPAQMHDSLSRLAALPADTRVCCAHEYTLSNLKFAAAVEPGNADIAAMRAEAEGLRARGVPTLPSTIGRERLVNPFLRCSEPAVVRAAAARSPGLADRDDTSPADVLAVLREWKNVFR